MKKSLALGTLLLAGLLIFGCSLGGKTYHLISGTSCLEVQANDPDLVHVLELLDYKKGSCPSSYKISKGCEYIDSSYGATFTYYISDYTNAEMQEFCDILGGVLVD